MSWCVRPIVLAAVVLSIAPSVAGATPVATTDGEYQLYGRVFPDPMGGCGPAGIRPCSPNAQGNVPAVQFLQFQELIDGLTYLNSKPEWQRYMEVWPLDGRIGENDSDQAPTDARAAFPGNTLPSFEFTPSAQYRSAGLPTTGTGRVRSDLIAVRVTDENVPDRGKKRYAVALSIHGIERAGAEGGTRAIEDLVTSFTTPGAANGDRKRAEDPVVPPGTIPGAPTFGEVLRRAIIYFVYPNPDGWRRGSLSEGGVFFQRYNGNGVDLNRDWPDRGFAFRPYSPLSEPEARAFAGMLGEIDRRDDGAPFGAAVDLHGQLTADALSYTLIGHGFKDMAKDIRVRETSKAIHRVSERMLAWSPIVVPNDTPKSQLGCSTPVTGDGIEACARIYGQTWGTVYDTINYTTTGTLGDWMDSAVGLDTDGLDNEMSFSHLDRNIVFEPQGEQLHVDGNKALIYAQIAQLLNPPGAAIDARGRTAYVPNQRLTRGVQRISQEPPAGTVAQAEIREGSGEPEGPARVAFGFPVKRGPQPGDGSPDAGKDVFSGGFRVEVTKLNAQGISDGNAVTTLAVQCRGCDDHPGVDPDNEGWITVAEDFNQSPVYAQAGLIAAVNRPQAVNREGKAVEWRAVLEGSPVDQGARFDVIFTQGPATVTGDTSGSLAPQLSAYDVANTDVFRDMDRYRAQRGDEFVAVDPARVASGAQDLDGFANLVLADVVPHEDGFWERVTAWVRAGGNLVLTDGALQALPRVAGIAAGAVESRKQYVGQVSFESAEETATLEEPLLTSPQTIAQDGARFNSSTRRQLYEATPLGFAIQYTQSEDDAAVGDDRAESPAWDVARQALETAGGKVVASAVEGGPAGDSPMYDRVAMGEIPTGEGTVRFLGALLPQPSQAFDHDFGLEPYALTYTGFILLCNMLDAVCSSESARPAGVEERGCQASRGFRSASVKSRGRRVEFRFRRRVSNPVRVDVFQSSTRRVVLGERLVARFAERAGNFTWNGRATVRGRRVRDGYFVVRYRIRAGRRHDTRRFALRRSHRRWSVVRRYYRRQSCGLLPSFKLERPVFGGRRNRALGISYRLGRRARVSVRVAHRGRTVKRWAARTRQAHQTFRLRFDAEDRSVGVYRVTIVVRDARGRTARAALVARRI